MTKYYKRGLREYYQISPVRVIRVINKMDYTQVIIHLHSPEFPSMIVADAEEGQEITRDEFAEQFKVASRLIVMEP